MTTNEKKTEAPATAAALDLVHVTPELGVKFKRFLQQVIKNKDIYFSSQSSEGSEDSEGSESSENSEASEDSEGSESEFFEALLAVDPNPEEWGKVLLFGSVVSKMITRE